MPRPRPAGGEPRRPVPLRLSPLEEAPVRALADAEHDGNLSEALRHLIALGLAVHEDRGIVWSDAGAVKLDDLARAGESRADTARRLIQRSATEIDRERARAR